MKFELKDFQTTSARAILDELDEAHVAASKSRLLAACDNVPFHRPVTVEWDIIALKVEEGRKQSRVLLRCLPPAALASGWVALERSTAVHRDPANAGRRFIPLLLGDCDLPPDTLRRCKVVDFREESDAAFAEVPATVCLWFCEKMNALDSAIDARLFDGETELSLVA